MSGPPTLAHWPAIPAKACPFPADRRSAMAVMLLARASRSPGCTHCRPDPQE
jgi:hypothetical protein